MVKILHLQKSFCSKVKIGKIETWENRTEDDVQPPRILSFASMRPQCLEYDRTVAAPSNVECRRMVVQGSACEVHRSTSRKGRMINLG